MTSGAAIDREYGTAAGDDLAVAFDIALEVANDTGLRQLVALCRCGSGRHFSLSPVERAPKLELI